MTMEEDQVIVIGSGPCGAVAAERLVERGLNVVMLDAGLRAPRGLLARVAGRTVLRRKGWAEYAQHRLDPLSDSGAVWVSSLSLGGLSNYWTSAIPRYAPQDFTDGARIDERYRWPVTYDELVPYYERLEPAMGLASGDPIRGVPPGRARHNVRLPDDWRSVAARAAEHGHGLGATPMARGRSTMLVRRGTEYSSYHCVVAPLQSSRSFRLLTGAYVSQLNWTNSSNRVESVSYIDRRTGRPQTIRGRAVVVAAGAIDSTVILLRSTSRDFPTGLGNSRGLIGRYLHDHPREWWRARVRTPMSALGNSVYVARRDHDSSEPLMSTSLTIGLTDSRSDQLKTLYGGRTHGIGVQVLGTMVPTPDVGVVLDSSEGLRPSIHLRYDDQARLNLEAARDRLREILGSAGLDAEVPGPFHVLTPGSSVHYGGTVRMHNDPDFGVLDRWNRMHDVDNVVVADSSSFPTGPEKNPTLTSMALAVRAADRLADDLSSGRLR